MKLKDKITEAVPAILSASNAMRSADYGAIFFWQEVGSLAEKKLKEAWAAAQLKLLPDDEGMRALGEGEHIVAEDKRFSVVAKVSKPGERFDLDTFIAAVAKKYKADPVALKALADASKKQAKPSLSKRVLEA